MLPRVVFFDAAVVLQASAEIVQLMTHRVDTKGRFFIADIRFKLVLSRPAVHQLKNVGAYINFYYFESLIKHIVDNELD